MLQPHPMNMISSNDNVNIPNDWNSWFRDNRDQLHLGETPEETQSVVSTGITLPAEVNDLLIRIVSSSAGNIDINNIQAGFDGQRITLEGESSTKTVTLKEGGNLILGGDIVISNNVVVRLHYNANKSLWIKN